jgi:hypothetical protein
MTTPDSQIPASVHDGARLIGSCSRYQMSYLGGAPFAGVVQPWDVPSAHNQELLIAYVMGMARLLEAKGVITTEEFVASVEEWLSSRKEWAESLANATVTAWNADNIDSIRPLLDIDNLGNRNVQTPDPHPLWPWMHDEAPVQE